MGHIFIGSTLIRELSMFNTLGSDPLVTYVSLFKVMFYWEGASWWSSFFKRGDLDDETFVDGLHYGLEVLMV